MQTVSRYGTQGFLEDLPSLNVGRYYHGCGAYLKDDGAQVLQYFDIGITKYIIFCVSINEDDIISIHYRTHFLLSYAQINLICFLLHLNPFIQKKEKNTIQ